MSGYSAFERGLADVQRLNSVLSGDPSDLLRYQPSKDWDTPAVPWLPVYFRLAATSVIRTTQLSVSTQVLRQHQLTLTLILRPVYPAFRACTRAGEGAYALDCHSECAMGHGL